MFKQLIFFITLTAGFGLQAMDKKSYNLSNSQQFKIKIDKKIEKKEEEHVSSITINIFNDRNEIIASAKFTQPQDNLKVRFDELTIFDPEYQNTGLGKQLAFFVVKKIIEKCPQAKTLVWDSIPIDKKYLNHSSLDQLYKNFGGQKTESNCNFTSFEFDLTHLKKHLSAFQIQKVDTTSKL